MASPQVHQSQIPIHAAQCKIYSLEISLTLVQKPVFIDMINSGGVILTSKLKHLII